MVSDVKALREKELVRFTVENLQLLAVDLRSYNLTKTKEIAKDFEACWATWTVPFDLVEEIYFLATAELPELARIGVLGGPAVWN